MKKFLLTATAIAALTAMSSSALAVNLDLTPTGADKYACELTTATTVFASPNLTATHLVGPGISIAVQKFFKYTLTNGTFQTPLTSASLVVGALPPADVTIVEGGGLNQNYVIFQVSPSAVVNVGDSVVLTVPDVKPGVAASPINLTYEMYDTLGGAQNSILIQRNYIKTGALVDGCATALAFSAMPNTTTVDVDAVPLPYLSFLDGVNGPGGTLAKIGNVQFEPVLGVLNPFTGLQVAMNELVKVGTKLVLKTNQSWASMANPPVGVYLSGAAGNCLVPPGGAIVGTVFDATTIHIQTNALASATRAICYQANGTTPIDVQDFTVAFDVVPQTAPNPATTADQPAVPAGKFIRNGTILKHAFIQTGAGVAGFTHSVHLANRSALPASYKVLCLTENGTFQGAANPVALAPYQARSFPVGAAGLGCTRGDTRGIELVFGVPNGSVIGAVLRTNTTTGETNYDTMIGSQIGLK